MKVVYVLSAIDYSGAEIVLERFLNDNKDIKPIFVCIYRNERVVKKLKENYNEVYELGLELVPNILRFIPWIDINRVEKKLISLLSSIQFDIIYANNTIEALLVSKFVKKNRVKSIAHIHDMKESIKSPIRKYYTSIVLNYYDKIITPSIATKNQWNNDNIVTVYNGLKSDFFINDKKNYTEIRNIGFIGGLSKRKGIDEFIACIETLVDKNCEIYVATRDIESKYYSQIKEISSKYSQVKLYVDLDTDEIVNLLDKLDLLVVPSRFDPLPTVIMEATARKTLVLGRAIDGIPEMISDSKFLYTDKMINKVLEIKDMNREELQASSERMFDYTQRKFLSSYNQQLLLGVYADVLKNHRETHHGG